jgi:hypothetical protein
MAYTPRVGTLAVVHTDGDTVRRTLPSGCTLTDVLGATVELACVPLAPNDISGLQAPVLQDSGIGAYTQPLGVAASPFLALDQDPDDEESSQAIVSWLGRRWITGWVEGYNHGGGYTSEFFLSRATGAVQYAQRLDAHQIEDAGTPTHTRTLCAPLAVPSAPPDDSVDDGVYTGRAPYVYDKPWALTTDAGGRPILQRCGHRTAPLVRCGACTGVTLAGHRLGWTDGRLLVVRDLSGGRSRHWRLPAKLADGDQLLLTEDAAFVALGSTLYRADLD